MQNQKDSPRGSDFQRTTCGSREQTIGEYAAGQKRDHSPSRRRQVRNEAERESPGADACGKRKCACRERERQEAGGLSPIPNELTTKPAAMPQERVA